MDKEQILLESYRIYNESKENFIDRSFSTNKFYLVIEIILLAAVAFSATMLENHLVVAVLSGLGVLIASLWWFNHDSYEYLIKIKYKHVLEKIEELLPVAPTTMEYKAAQEDAKKRKVFVFSNAHKVLSFLVLLIFLSFFVTAVAPYIAAIFTTEVI